MRRLTMVLVLGGVGIGAWLLGRETAARLPLAARLTVATTPPGAGVFVDGEFRGCAGGGTLTCEVAEGRHLVHVSAAGYQGWSEVVEIGPEAPPLTVALQPNPEVRLEVITHPPGAAVILDGHVRGRSPLEIAGLAPGHHALELSMTNYLSEVREVALSAAETGRVEVDLKHRQVEAYRARIRKDPGDILNYNDLGALLYVLGRHQEAAAAFVEGFLAAGQYGKRDEPNQRNTKKLEREARNKHTAPEFQQAFDQAILKTMAAGRVSPQLLAEFRRVPRQLYPAERLQALEGVARAHPEDVRYAFELLEFHRQNREYDKLLGAVDGFLKQPSLEANSSARLLDLLRNVYGLAPAAERGKILASMRHVLEVALPRYQSQGRDGEHLYEQATLARLEGKEDAQRELLEKAVAKQPAGRMANAWRLEVAQLWQARQDYAKALAHLRIVAASRDSRDPSVYKAKKLLEEVEKQKQEQEARAAPAKPAAAP